MPQNILTLLFIPLMIVAFYFLLIRPQRKRQQAQQKLLNELQPGARVMTTTGMFGTLVSMGDKQAVLQVSPGVEITVLRQAVSRTVTDADEDAPESLEGGDAEPTFEPYEASDTSEPSTLDLASEQDSGIRDVTSSYRGAAANATADEVADEGAGAEGADGAVDREVGEAPAAPSDGPEQPGPDAPADAPAFEAPQDAPAEDAPEVPRKEA